MSEITQGSIGQAGKYDLKWENGQLVVEVDAGVGASSAGIVLKIDAKQVLDSIAKLGTLEASVVGVIEAAILPMAVAAAPSA